MSINKILVQLNDEDEAERKEFDEGFLVDSIDRYEVEILKKSVLEKFGVKLSEEYIELLKLSNGLSVNGLNIYASKPYDHEFYINGIIDINSEFWTEPTLTNYFAYGDESSTRLVYNLATHRYEAVDSVTWEKLNDFHSFSELLSHVISECYIFD